MGCFEFRTAVAPLSCATSTHWLLALDLVLLRQTAPDKLIPASLHLLSSVRECSQQANGLVQTGRYCAQVLKQQVVTPEFGFLLQEEVASQRVDVHHVRICRIRELEQSERARHPRVGTGAELDDLEGDVRLGGP